MTAGLAILLGLSPSYGSKTVPSALNGTVMITVKHPLCKRLLITYYPYLFLSLQARWRNDGQTLAISEGHVVPRVRGES